MREVHNALEMSDDKFNKLYGTMKPDENDQIVFVCMVGIRSHTALMIAKELGYRKWV